MSNQIDLYGMNHNMAKLKYIEKFDGAFFGIMHKMGDHIDPAARILLETTYECIVDAGRKILNNNYEKNYLKLFLYLNKSLKKQIQGINPDSLRGSDTGVYIGYSTIGMPEGLPEEIQPDLQSSVTDTILWYPGAAKCMYANRLSFLFDFKGPSIVIDTACSSSMVALDLALTDLRLGK